MTELSALMLMFFAAHASGPTLPDTPDAPKRETRFNRTEWSLLATDAAVRGPNVFSTRWALQAGNKETTLPGWMVNHSQVMALYPSAIVGTEYQAARKLFAHRHRKLANAVTVADLAVADVGSPRSITGCCVLTV
jgi:hypothetical protein